VIQRWLKAEQRHKTTYTQAEQDDFVSNIANTLRRGWDS
jgi:hypothetical protein